MTESVERGGVAEEVEIEMGECGVVVDVRLEERNQVLGCEERFEMQFDYVGQVVQLGLGGWS